MSIVSGCDNLDPSQCNEAFCRELASFGLSEGVHFIHFYTDGSRFADGSIGYAILCDALNISRRICLPSELTIFDAEALAILYTLEMIDSHHVDGSIIFSDSLSAIRAIAGQRQDGRGNKWVLMIRDIIFDFTKNNQGRIILAWMPGHCGIRGNEIVDQFAKEAAGRLNVDITHSLITPMHLFEEFKHGAGRNFESWLTREAELRGYRYFNRTKTKPEIPWYECHEDLPRSCIALISRIRTHHVFLRSHLHDKGMTDSPLCECAQESETIQHAFTCRRHLGHVIWLFASLYLAGVNLGESILDICYSNNKNAWELLDSFVKRTKIHI